MIVLKPHGFNNATRIRPCLDKLTEQSCLSYFIETVIKNGKQKTKYILVHGDFNPDLEIKQVAIITDKWYELSPDIYSIPNSETIINEIEELYKKDSFVSQCLNWLKP